MKLQRALRRAPFLVTAFLTAALATGMPATGARADIKYTRTSVTDAGGADAGGAQAGAFQMRSTHYVADGKERNETEMNIGDYKSVDAQITLCASNETIHVDDNLKIYATVDNSGESATSSVPPIAGGGRASKEKPGTGKISVNVQVQELAPEKVSGWDTKHYMVAMHTKTSGCIGDGSNDVKMELWVADVQDAHACKDVKVDYSQFTGQQAGGQCKVTYETTGDTAKMEQVWSGLVMRQKIYSGDKALMTQEITSLSQAKLEDSIFAVPEGYRKVSYDEYNKLRQQAMMKAMMGGMKLPF